MILGFKRNRDDYEDDEEEEIEYVLFQGAMNGQEANLAQNARLAEAGLVPVKELLTDAMLRRAEILRIEPKGNVAVVTFAVDGVWYPGGRLPKQHALAVSQMVKLLAGLDIKQRKKSQKGGIKSELSGQKYDLFVESTPVAGGAERIVVRITDPKVSLESADEIGIPPKMKERIRELAGRKTGVMLICGPPRSGTSTTTIGVLRCVDAYLYTIYNIANLEGRDLAHVADFKAEPGDDLETTIGRVIRIEADVILTDPLKDAEMAATIFKMQKKVGFLSELAARDSAHGIMQLNRWLEDPELLANGLNAIISQKLIRLLCDGCKEAYRPHPKMLIRVGLPPETKVLYRPPTFPESEEEEEGPEPCDQCSDIGYRGRTAMFEFYEITEGMREVITAGPSLEILKKQAKRENLQTFQQAGLRLVAEGKTSLEELQRVFQGK